MPHPFAPSPEGAAPYLDLGSFIFEFQTFLEGTNKRGVEWVQKSYPPSPCLSILVLESVLDSVCKLVH